MPGSAPAPGRGVRASPSHLGAQGVSLGLTGSLWRPGREQRLGNQRKVLLGSERVELPKPCPCTQSRGGHRAGHGQENSGPSQGPSRTPFLEKSGSDPRPLLPRVSGCPSTVFLSLTGKLHFPLFFHKTP